MAEDIPIKTIIELIFFALFLFMAIYLLYSLYGALFPDTNYLPELQQRVEFVACGSYNLINEKECPSEYPARNLFIAEAERTDRLVFFDRKDQVVNGEDMFTVEAVSPWDFSLVYLPNFNALQYENPCEGPCICQFDITQDEEFSKNMCVELDFEEPIPMYSYAETGVYASVRSFVRSLFTDQQPDSYQKFGESLQAPFIVPMPASWWTSIDYNLQDSGLYYFLIEIEYRPDTQGTGNPSLLITPYNPAEQIS